ncbi:MAG: glycosyltransferase family 39 protein [Erysipelotrichaceae bacterium]
MYSYLEGFFIVVTLLCLFYSFHTHKIEMTISDQHFKICIFLIFSLFLFVSFYRLDTLPYGLHVDEAGMAYDALSLANYSTDRYLYHFPVYLINYGGGQSALYAYLCAFLIKLFGLSTFIIRLPIALLKMISFFCIYTMFKQNKLHCLILLTLYTITPYFIMQARFGLDCNLMLPMICISTALLFNALKYQKLRIFFLAGVLFGLTLYSYALSYLTIPIYLLLVFSYGFYKKQFTFKQLFTFFLPLSLLAFPLILNLLVNHNWMSEVDSWISLPKLFFFRNNEIGLDNISDNLYIFKMLFTSDNQEIYGNLLDYNALPSYKTLYLFSSIFAIIGLYSSIKQLKKKQFNLNVIFLAWAASSLITLFLISNPNINKANAIFIPLIYFVSLGIIKVVKNRKLLSIIFIMYSCSFISFSHYYFTSYNENDSHLYWFATDYLDALSYAESLDIDEIYATSVTAENYIYVYLLQEKKPISFNEERVYSENTHITYYFIDELTFDTLQNDACYITDINWITLLEQAGYTFYYQSFNDIVVLYF